MAKSEIALHLVIEKENICDFDSKTCNFHGRIYRLSLTLELIIVDCFISGCNMTRNSSHQETDWPLLYAILRYILPLFI